MHYSSIRDFVEEVHRIGELRIIEGAEISEIGPIAALARMTDECPAVLFDKVKDYPSGFRVFANNINSPKRVALALGIDPMLQPIEILRTWKEKRKSINPVPIQKVANAPFTENTLTNERIRVLQFPVPQWHEMDGGRYIGSGCVSIVRDPDEDWVNLGIYRVQVHDDRTLVIHFDHFRRHGYLIAKKYWDRGLSCPIALACGEDPALFLAASEGSPWGVSEFGFAGWLRGQGIAVLESDLTGLPLPVSSEIIIEGEIPSPEQLTELEGPFGESTGYYTGAPHPSPVIQIKRIMHRNDPILSGNAPLRPPYHTAGIPLDAAHVWNDLEKSGVRNVSSVWKPSRWVTVISMHQDAEGEAKRAGEIAVTSRGVYLDRFIVIVDDDIDPTSTHDLLWAMSTRCEPSSCITIYSNLEGSTLDPLVSPERAAKGDFSHSKVVIDACRPFRWRDKFPPTNTLTSDTKQHVCEKWLELLLSPTAKD